METKSKEGLGSRGYLAQWSSLTSRILCDVRVGRVKFSPNSRPVKNSKLAVHRSRLARNKKQALHWRWKGNRQVIRVGGDAKANCRE